MVQKNYLTQRLTHISSALVRSKSPREDIRKRTSTWTRNPSADLNTTYIHFNLESIPRYPTAHLHSFHFGSRLSLTPSYHPSNSHFWTLKWKLTSTIPVRQGRGEVMKLLIIIQGRRKTEGLAKEMERVTRLWGHSRRGCQSGRGLTISGGWTRSNRRDRTRYQELQGYRVSLFVLYL